MNIEEVRNVLTNIYLYTENIDIKKNNLTIWRVNVKINRLTLNPAPFVAQP